MLHNNTVNENKQSNSNEAEQDKISPPLHGFQHESYAQHSGKFATNALTSAQDRLPLLTSGLLDRVINQAEKVATGISGRVSCGDFCAIFNSTILALSYVRTRDGPLMDTSLRFPLQEAPLTRNPRSHDATKEPSDRLSQISKTGVRLYADVLKSETSSRRSVDSKKRNISGGRTSVQKALGSAKSGLQKTARGDNKNRHLSRSSQKSTKPGSQTPKGEKSVPEQKSSGAPIGARVAKERVAISPGELLRKTVKQKCVKALKCETYKRILSSIGVTEEELLQKLDDYSQETLSGLQQDLENQHLPPLMRYGLIDLDSTVELRKTADWADLDDVKRLKDLADRRKTAAERGKLPGWRNLHVPFKSNYRSIKDWPIYYMSEPTSFALLRESLAENLTHIIQSSRGSFFNTSEDADINEKVNHHRMILHFSKYREITQDYQVDCEYYESVISAETDKVLRSVRRSKFRVSLVHWKSPKDAEKLCIFVRTPEDKRAFLDARRLYPLEQMLRLPSGSSELAKMREPLAKGAKLLPYATIKPETRDLEGRMRTLQDYLASDKNVMDTLSFAGGNLKVAESVKTQNTKSETKDTSNKSKDKEGKNPTEPIVKKYTEEEKKAQEDQRIATMRYIEQQKVEKHERAQAVLARERHALASKTSTSGTLGKAQSLGRGKQAGHVDKALAKPGDQKVKLSEPKATVAAKAGVSVFDVD